MSRMYATNAEKQKAYRDRQSNAQRVTVTRETVTVTRQVQELQAALDAALTKISELEKIVLGNALGNAPGNKAQHEIISAETTTTYGSGSGEARASVVVFNSNSLFESEGAGKGSSAQENKDQRTKKKVHIGRKSNFVAHEIPDEDSERIWKAWPKRRRVKKKKFEQEFRVALKKVDRAVLIAKAMMVAESPKALEDDGQFIPDIWRWFKNEGWEDQPERYAADKPKTNGKPEKKEPAFLGMPNLDLGD